MDVAQRCSECGWPSPPDARFCGGCGAAVEQPSAEALLPPTPRRRAVRWVAIALVVATLTLIAVSSSRDGPVSEQDRSSMFPELPAAAGVSPGAVVWRRTIDPGPVSTDTSHVYATADGGIVAIDRYTGEESWRSPVAGWVGDPLGSSLPVIGSDDRLHVLDASDGSARAVIEGLRDRRPAAVTTPPFVVTIGKDSLTALSTTGRSMWEAQLDGVGWVERGVGTGNDVGLVFVTMPRSLVALHPLTGAVAWEQAVERPVGPVVVAGRTTVVRGDEGFVGLDVRTGEPRWTAPGAGALTATPGGLLATIPVGARRTVDLLDPGSGEVTAVAELPGEAIGFAQPGRELVVVGWGAIWALAEDGEVEWGLDVPTGVRDVVRTADRLVLVRDAELVAVQAPR